MNADVCCGERKCREADPSLVSVGRQTYFEYFRPVFLVTFHFHGGTGSGSDHRPLCSALASSSRSPRLRSPEPDRFHQANPSFTSSRPMFGPFGRCTSAEVRPCLSLTRARTTTSRFPTNAAVACLACFP